MYLRLNTNAKGFVKREKKRKKKEGGNSFSFPTENYLHGGNMN